MKRFIMLIAGLMALIPAAVQAQEKHPSFDEKDMMNPYTDGRTAHQEKMESTSREWSEDWYGYAEQRYGTNPIAAAGDKKTEKNTKEDAPVTPETESSETPDDAATTE